MASLTSSSLFTIIVLFVFVALSSVAYADDCGPSNYNSFIQLNWAAVGTEERYSTSTGPADTSDDAGSARPARSVMVGSPTSSRDGRAWTG